MILWNTPEVRDALRRALATLEQPMLAGNVVELDMTDGDILLCVIADEPIHEDRAFAVRYSTAPRAQRVG
ncbi:hypothetical protein [Pseudonocardia sp. NPDC049154]|uniref:hypothetical protein n=1 Tax=Pseudonocardia sp. NPDC049154 TaxID=3155501 RepID=UPI0033EFE5AD